MNKADALQLIDDHKNKLIDPVNLLHWAWMRVIIKEIPDNQWEAALEKALDTLSA